MGNIINLSDYRPRPRDPWEHAQPILISKGGREELWPDTYFGVRQLIWATGSHTTPEPPSPPTGGTPAAANLREYTKLKVSA